MNNVETVKMYSELIREYTMNNYKKCFREPSGKMKYKYIVPGSCYSNGMWDWDSWLTGIALSTVLSKEEIEEYEKGCVLNYINFVEPDGTTPFCIAPDSPDIMKTDGKKTNIHKPTIAQHALFISKTYGDAEWIADKLDVIELYLKYYDSYCKHETGLYIWLDDRAIGVDNDPCTFFRPDKSSASVYLNSLMYKEFLSLSELYGMLNRDEKSDKYKDKAEALKNAIFENCWDERDGFFYSVDVNLRPVEKAKHLHSGSPRHWNCLIQRIEVWSCFLAMWAGIATEEQAERIVKEHYLDERTFYAPYGVRTLSKMEKMYAIVKSGNPSCWLGPVWGVSNYMVFEGLAKYGYHKAAEDLAIKTVLMFGKDIEKNGEMHEYYHPETGEGINNPGFQNWNLLVNNMIEYLRDRNIL